MRANIKLTVPSLPRCVYRSSIFIKYMEDTNVHLDFLFLADVILIFNNFVLYTGKEGFSVFSKTVYLAEPFFNSSLCNKKFSCFCEIHSLLCK